MRYWIDLDGVKLNDDGTQWVHAFPVDKTYKHPLYGTLEFTRDRLQRFASNIVNNIRGIDLDIDYDHKVNTREAAGWIKNAEVRDNGLWVLVEWTKDAAEKVRNKSYRYFSPEFRDEWEDGEGKKHQDVLFGGALTNRPFLKELVPINLSEVLEETNMDEATRKALIAKLGLSDDASDETILAELDKAKLSDGSKFDLSKAKVDKQEDGTFKITADGAEGEVVVKPETKPEPVLAGEPTDEQIKKLAETDPALAQYLSEAKKDREATADRLAQLEASNKLSEANAKLSEIKGLPPAVRDMLRPILVRASSQLSEDIHKAVVKLAEVGIVPEGQKHEPDPKKTTHKLDEPISSQAVQKFLDEVDSEMEKNKELSYTEATQLVVEKNPDLWKQYNKALAEEDVEV